MNHFLSFFDLELKTLLELAERSLEIKSGSHVDSIQGKILGLLFFNPSLRTRTSLEVAMAKFGGQAVALTPGSDAWNLEYRDGAIMDQSAPEHVKEGARVLSRYFDAIGVRSFSSLDDATKNTQGDIIESFRRWSTVPVINMESATEHPLQALSDMVTLREKLGEPKNKRFILTWAPQVRPTPMAVPHSALLCACASGMDVTVVHPPQYELLSRYASFGRELSEETGGSIEFKVVESGAEQEQITKEGDIVYVKSWGAVPFYSSIEKQEMDFAKRKDWMVTPRHLKKGAYLMHCLPVRRNVVVSDSALDSPNSIVIDQAENRLWAQSSLLERIFS